MSSFRPHLPQPAMETSERDPIMRRPFLWRTCMRRLSFLLAVLPAVTFAATPIEMTQEEFKMYRHWQKAMQDPRVQKIKPNQQNAAIAKDAKFKLKDMEAAIQKGDAAGDLKATCEANLKESLANG